MLDDDRSCYFHLALEQTTLSENTTVQQCNMTLQLNVCESLLYYFTYYCKKFLACVGKDL